MSDIITREREMIKAFLNYWAKMERQHASALRSDSSQNEPDAKCADIRASTLELAAQAIIDGRHQELYR